MTQPSLCTVSFSDATSLVTLTSRGPFLCHTLSVEGVTENSVHRPVGEGKIAKIPRRGLLKAYYAYDKEKGRARCRQRAGMREGQGGTVGGSE